MLNDLRGTPLAGLVIVGDFAENAGLKSEIAVQSAIDAKIPVYTIAIGSNRIPVNVGIVDFRVPPRAYPGDKFQVEAVLQVPELDGRSVTVELVSRLASEKPDAEGGSVDATEVIRLGKDREQQIVKFELPGIKETGRRTMTVRLAESTTTAIRPTIRCRSTWRSSNERTPCCYLPAVRRASISSSAIN